MLTRDQGVWSFMIIQGLNQNAKWFLHDVMVNFFDNEGAMIQRSDANGNNSKPKMYNRIYSKIL